MPVVVGSLHSMLTPFAASYKRLNPNKKLVYIMTDGAALPIYLSKNVDTLIFGGLDRGIDYSEFIKFLETSEINNLICMPTTGNNIGKILEEKTTKNRRDSFYSLSSMSSLSRTYRIL